MCDGGCGYSQRALHLSALAQWVSTYICIDMYEIHATYDACISFPLCIIMLKYLSKRDGSSFTYLLRLISSTRKRIQRLNIACLSIFLASGTDSIGTYKGRILLQPECGGFNPSRYPQVISLSFSRSAHLGKCRTQRPQKRKNIGKAKKNKNPSGRALGRQSKR